MDQLIQFWKCSINDVNFFYLFQAKKLICRCYGEQNSKQEVELDAEVADEPFTEADTQAVLDNLPDNPNEKICKIIEYFFKRI